MHSSIKSNRARCESLLASQPALRKAFSAVLSILERIENVSVGVKGSIHKGRIDQFSDVDFAVWYPRGVNWRILVEDAGMALRGIGALLAQFPATHLGMPNLLVFFGKTEGSIVKVDIEFWELGQSVPKLGDVTILQDPAGQLQKVMESSTVRSEAPDLAFIADVDQKLCGWIWYTYAKIARGELHESVSSLTIMRERGLIVLIQLTRGLPLEGLRHVESRLDPQTLKALRHTYPRFVARKEAFRALLALCRQYVRVRQQLASQLEGLKFGSQPDIMIETIRQMEQSWTDVTEAPHEH